jgi:hypothetical protein
MESTIASNKTDAIGHGYPRPQLTRSNWMSLNGTWQFNIDHDAKFTCGLQVPFDHTQIHVPFAPETCASGINDTGFYNAVWYRRNFETAKLSPGERLILHFGAVDWNARVWVNGKFAIEHDGGYTPFSVDITDLLGEDAQQVLVVRAEDNPHDLEKNRGKQDWEEKEHSIWYQRTTGIWQTVWMEVVNAAHIQAIDWHPAVQDCQVKFVVHLAGTCQPGTSLSMKLSHEAHVLVDETFTLTEADRQLGELRRSVKLTELEHCKGIPDGSFERLKGTLMWHPDHPAIIDAVVVLRSSEGQTLDTVESYTQLTTVEASHSRLIFNGREEVLRLALDQGYWPSTGMTPPDDAAIVRDIELLIQAGFNGVRKHNKLEDPRFLYWADRLGLFVWEELPSAYLFSKKAVQRSTKLWTEAIQRDRNHGCIIAWVPLNESWGVPDLPEQPLQRQYQRSMYHLTKVLTMGGIVIGNDGWEMVESDIVAIHDYDADLDRIARRYAQDEQSTERLFRDERPGGKVLILEGMDHTSRPKMLTEFGGIKLSKDEGSWGYSVATSPEDLADKYTRLMSVIWSLPMFGGFCYTEFTDVYQEANGLFWMDRVPKFPLEVMRKATCGAR